MTYACRFTGLSARLALLGVLATATTLHAQPPALVVLAETGESRASFPVLKAHPDAQRVVSALARGFPARMLRLYQLEQAYLAKQSGSRPEPAYLLLSSRQGGFPVVGFWLGSEDKRRTAYVDLYKDSNLDGRFGAMDQIFPHELGHIIVRQLAGEPRRGGSSQMHAIAVCTDPEQAFSEGFAEHFQVMALDDADASPATARLRADPFWQQRTERELEDYRRELIARWAPAAPRRMTFPLWFSANEQILRWYAVKANLFARAPEFPEHLLAGTDPYAAYLLENIVPGRPSDPAKPVARLLSTEGVVAALFYRWATSADLQNHFLDDSFYAQFGTTAAEVPPAMNVYLKLLHVIHLAKPDTTIGFVDAYRRTWPDEAPTVDRLVSEVLLGQTPRPAPEIWLANAAFHVGTTMFDQWRAAPVVRTFDLNAASIVDLVAVPGIDSTLARQILRRLPVERIQDLRNVPGMTAELERRFEQMAAPTSRGDSDPEGDMITRLAPVFWAYPKRAALVWLVAAAAATLLFRRLAGRGWTRAVLDGLAASIVTLVAGWITWPSFAAVFASTVVFGLPAVWTARRHGDSWTRAGLVLASWLAAAAPAWLLLTPLL